MKNVEPVSNINVSLFNSICFICALNSLRLSVIYSNHMVLSFIHLIQQNLYHSPLPYYPKYTLGGFICSMVKTVTFPDAPPAPPRLAPKKFLNELLCNKTTWLYFTTDINANEKCSISFCPFILSLILLRKGISYVMLCPAHSLTKM